MGNKKIIVINTFQRCLDFKDLSHDGSHDIFFAQIVILYRYGPQSCRSIWSSST